MKKALLSVSDKEGIVELGKFLSEQGVELISSGGTRKSLEDAGVKVTPVENVTGNPEAFGGRMKTLSFQISSALLYRRGHQEDEKQAKELEIDPIDLVVCNLYPFSEVVKKNGSYEELIENIDIGGPTMVRAAAKNHQSVAVLTNPGQYGEFIEAFQKDQIDFDLRKKLALEAFSHTAAYDSLIAQTLNSEVNGDSQGIHIDLSDKKNVKEARYGENPHQKGYVIVDPLRQKGRVNTLAAAPSLQGKELSYNNLLDADAAWRCNSDLNRLCDQKKPYAVTIIKHANPCGAAIGADLLATLTHAWEGDNVSAFGSIIAFNCSVNEEAARFFENRFVEVIIAPSFDKEARDIFSKKKNLRLIELAALDKYDDFNDLMVRSIDGGFVVQEEDNGVEKDIDIIVGDHDGLKDSLLLNFGIKVTKHLKSNAISLVGKDQGTIFLFGAGMGNPNRRVSLEQAVAKARENGHDDLSQCLLVSDAFFPFRDNIDLSSEFGIKAIVQPGGSIKDKEVIQACEEKGVSMAFTGMRHFRH